MDNMPKTNEGSWIMLILGLCIFLWGIHLFRINWNIIGVILIVVGGFLIFGGCFLIYDELPTKKNIEKQRKINIAIEKAKHKKIKQDNDRIEMYKKEVERMNSLYGKITKEIRYKNTQYGLNMSKMRDTIYVFESSSIILINGNPYKFENILSYSVSDNSVVIYSKEMTTSKYDNKNVLGRAIIGGVLGGVAGAVVGGSTAKTNISISDRSSHTSHDYIISITINDLSNPLIEIHIGVDTKIMQEISSIFSIICERNKLNMGSSF